MNMELELIDISDDLLVLNKKTIETLFTLENSVECVALYMLYYKTAKWQKTNQIKATDEYAKKVLKIGKNKLLQAKKTLKEYGLIDIIQKRENNKIAGWYIKVSYIVEKRDVEDVKVLIQDNLSKKSQNEQVLECTSSFQNTNALKINNKCLNNKNINTVEELLNYASELENKLNINTSNLEDIKQIIDYLNKKLGTKYGSSNKETQKHIKARLKEGFTLEDFKTVIDKQYDKWIGTDMQQYLRPETLFGTKFESYLNAPKQDKKNNLKHKQYEQRNDVNYNQFYDN